MIFIAIKDLWGRIAFGVIYNYRFDPESGEVAGLAIPARANMRLVRITKVH